MAKISQEILNSAWYKNLAAKAPADELDIASIQEVHASARGEIDSLKAALQSNGTNAILNEHFTDSSARKALLDLIADVEKSQSVATAPIVSSQWAASAPQWAPTVSPPLVWQEIAMAAWKATAAMESKLWKMNDKNAKEFLWAWQRVWSKVPGTEPTDMEDIGQAINQSRSFNEKLIAALVFEYNDTTPTLPVWWFSNMPGWFPALQKNHNFGTTPYNGKTWVEWKRAYIMDTMNALSTKWEQASTSNPEWLVSTVENIATWALPLFGYPALLLFAGKVWYNVLHGGIKKPWIGEAVWWSVGKVWDGSKWVLTAGKATIKSWYKSASGKFEAKVEAKDLKDTPPYTAEEWSKERARLEETTRRMIYMDSGKNPRHNPAATPAEIFQAVEATPALKTAFDARIVKLNELGNTLVGQQKYLSPEAFNKEARKIVAGDLWEGSIKKNILKRVPLTAERSDYKQTQEALKTVKWEIDAMRARLSAKAIVDDVEVPKVLETQLQAFEKAYKAAYEADSALDKSRNQITRTLDRINEIDKVIAKFEEIDALKWKIGDATSGLTKEIAELQASIKAAIPAANTENPADQRQRETEWKQGEIDAANRERETAMKEFDAHAANKKDTLKDKRIAVQAVIDEESRIRREILDRKTILQDLITKNSGNSSNAPAITEWQDEINGNRGKVKDLTDQLSHPHSGSALAAKKQAVTDAQDLYDTLLGQDTSVSRKVTDAETKIARLSGEKTAILSRAGSVNAASMLTNEKTELVRLKAEKAEIESKITTAKAEIDTIAAKPENRGFPRSTGGTLAWAQAELNRLEGLISSGGSLDVAKTTAKTARNVAFTQLNTTLTTLNTESTRLGAWLEIHLPQIGEFVKWQGYSEELSMRESSISWDKAADHKLKGERPGAVRTLIKRKS